MCVQEGDRERLQSWCSGNNFELNALKTVEMVVNFRRYAAPPPPVMLGESLMASGESKPDPLWGLEVGAEHRGPH